MNYVFGKGKEHGGATLLVYVTKRTHYRKCTADNAGFCRVCERKCRDLAPLVAALL